MPHPASPAADLPRHFHLYFGYEGRVPVGVDAAFPRLQVAAAEDHLRWAELLVDAGVYYQAQQQLDLLAEPAASSARAQWLRARVQRVLLHHARARSRRRLDENDGDILRPAWLDWHDQIEQRLADATQRDPAFGPAWLLAAEVALETHNPDFARAVEHARRARALLGDTPAVLAALGRALRGAGAAAEAVALLRRLPADSPEGRTAQVDLQLAAWQARCEGEPLDVAAHLQWGRWCLRHSEHERAKSLFTRLVERCPKRPEGYYGLGYLAFLRPAPHGTEAAKYTEAYRLCAKAIKRDDRFGLAYELAGSIFRNLRMSNVKVDFTVREPLPYYRKALALDPTCDTALAELAEEHLRREEIPATLDLLEKAAALDTTISMVYTLLAVIYQGRRQFDKLEWADARARELAPGLALDSGYRERILRLCGFEY